MSQLGDLGSGAGKGGGGGGSIREAGGSFGKNEAAREEEYFYKKVLMSYIICKLDITKNCLKWLFQRLVHTLAIILGALHIILFVRSK